MNLYLDYRRKIDSNPCSVWSSEIQIEFVLPKGSDTTKRILKKCSQRLVVVNMWNFNSLRTLAAFWSSFVSNDTPYRQTSQKLISRWSIGIFEWYKWRPLRKIMGTFEIFEWGRWNILRIYVLPFNSQAHYPINMSSNLLCFSQFSLLSSSQKCKIALMSDTGLNIGTLSVFEGFRLFSNFTRPRTTSPL